MSKPHFTQNVVVLIERRGVDAEGHSAAAPERLPDWRDAGSQMQVGTRIGRDHCARRRDLVQILRPRPYAMGERDSRREQPDRPQPFRNALRIGLVCKSALIARLQQMHVNATASFLRAARDGAQQFVGRPLRPVGSELHRERIAFDGLRDRLDARDLRGGVRHRVEECRLDGGAMFWRQARQRGVRGPINQGMAIAHEDRESHANPDVLRGARDLARLFDLTHRVMKAGVMRHHRAGAASRGATESCERGEIGVDSRQHAESKQPGFQRFAGAPKRRWRQRPCVVMRIGERRHGETSLRGRGRRRRDRRDMSRRDSDIDRSPHGRPIHRQKGYAREDLAHDLASSMMLTWAATMRQPSGKRTQVCICRPTLPGADSRRNRVAATAQSRP